MRSAGGTLGIWDVQVAPIGCTLGRTIYTETKRSAQLANLGRSSRALQATTIERLQPLFPATDLHGVRIRTRCRLPSNRFRESGSIYAMTFGSTIYFRDELDERNPAHLVHLIHEVIHVDQVRRFGGESQFACEYGKGFLNGGGQLPTYMDDVSAYHLNPLESEAYSFEQQFRDARGRVVPDKLPVG